MNGRSTYEFQAYDAESVEIFKDLSCSSTGSLGRAYYMKTSKWRRTKKYVREIISKT